MAVHPVHTSYDPLSEITDLDPPQKPEEYTITELVLKFFEEKAKDIAKALGYTAFWVNQMPGVPSQVQTFNTTMVNFKNFIAATEVPKKGYELYSALGDMATSLQELRQECGEWLSLPGALFDLTNEDGLYSYVKDSGAKVAAAGRVVFEKGTSMINSVVDGIDFSQNFIPIDSATMSTLKTVNYAATFGGAGNDAIKQIEKWSATDECETTKQMFYMINLAKSLSYVALGALGLSSVFLGATVAPWMFVATLSSGLFFTIFSYFYERINDPECKGKNLNPEAVIANRMLAG